MVCRKLRPLAGCLALWAFTVTVEIRADDLVQRLERAAPGDVLALPPGLVTSPLSLAHALTLRGHDPQVCIVDVTSNQPALTITAREPVVVEGLTIRWQLATSDRSETPPTALFVKDSTVTLRRCHLIASGNHKRSPSAILATGFSNLVLEECRFEGFEFSIGIERGAEATISDCVVSNPGHCGISVYAGSKMEVARTIVTGSEFHGIRSTGGTLDVHDCLIIENANRGVYLGNKSAHGRINNNVILGNGTGISGFARSNVTIEHNVIAGSSYAGVDARDTCLLKVRHNIFTDNTRGFVLFTEAGRNAVQLGSNSFWENQSNVENLAGTVDLVLADPAFAHADEGDFTTALSQRTPEGYGLTDPAPIQQLWKSWTDLARAPE